MIEHVGIMHADLQHHAARHAGGGVAPRREIEFAEPVAADIRLGIDHLAERAGLDLPLDPAEMAFAPTLIAEREHDAGLPANFGDLPPSDTELAIGLSRKTCFRHAAAWGVVSRCTWFGVVLMMASMASVFENGLVARCRLTAIFLGEGLTLFSEREKQATI